MKCLENRTVSGNVISFYDIIKNLKKFYPNLMIESLKRKGPMPHNGYRAFDISLLKKRFPKLSIIKLQNWIKKKEIYKA